MKQIDCKIEGLKKEDIIESMDVFDSELGKNYIESDKILSMIQDDRFVCLKASVDNKLVGVAIGFVMNLTEAIDYLKLAKYKIPSVMKKGDKIAVLKTCAITEEYQRKGIGGKFVGNLEKIFFKKGIKFVLSVVWRHDGMENSGPLLQKTGYKSLYIIDNYWEKESLQEGFSCPVCGDGGCHCSANIYFKELHD